MEHMFYCNHFDISNKMQIAGKLLNIKLQIRRSQRLVRESRSICTCECRVGNTTRMLWPIYIHLCLQTFV